MNCRVNSFFALRHREDGDETMIGEMTVIKFLLRECQSWLIIITNRKGRVVHLWLRMALMSIHNVSHNWHMVICYFIGSSTKSSSFCPRMWVNV